MVICAVVGCSKRSKRDKVVSFYRFPSVSFHGGEADFKLRKKRRDGYLAAISRKDINPDLLDDRRICSRHFVGGEPGKLYDVNNPAWLPTLNLGHNREDNDARASEHMIRYERAKERERKRNALQELLEQAPGVGTELIELTCAEEVSLIAAEQIKIASQYVKMDTSKEAERVCSSEIKSLQEKLNASELSVQTLTDTVKTLAQKVDEQLPPFCEKSFTSNDFTVFYTGLPNITIVKAIFEHVSKGLPVSSDTKLTPFQEFICVLIKLRTNTANEDLSYRFNVSCATVSRILLKWLKQMDIRLKDLIIWPDREVLQKTTPECFQISFGKAVAVIIDCFEIFMERPSNLQARASTWSNYKHHNTVKVLIGITPQGVVSFVSESWGGRVSDVYLTKHCGILKKLLPGDIVLADRGFDIAESVGIMQAKLHIPAFTKGKSQLSALEIEDTRKIANVWIHIERVIGCVRQKYHILQSTLPIHFVSTRKGEETPLIDRIIRICCALNNVCNSVVPFD